MTVKRIRFLQELLEFMGLGGRLHLAWISSAEAQKFAQVVADFTEQVRALGPNPLPNLLRRTATGSQAEQPLPRFEEAHRDHDLAMRAAQ
jgi:F420-non-reducing hydrogenase iron-sulfur subunit